MRQPKLSGRLARWVLKLQTYKFTISHRKGKENVVPDALSRMHCEEVCQIDSEPEVDLNSPHFSSPEYEALKLKIMENQEKFPDIKIVDRYVYIRTEHADGTSQEENMWKLWIPAELRKGVLLRLHDDVIAAHGGVHKTIELIRRKFYWPGLVKDVKNYVGNCEVCKTTKAPNIVLRPPMGAQATTDRPFQRLYIDLLGPYPRSKAGNIGLLIILDHMSKFHWLCPLKKFTSKIIIEFLQKSIFHVYGVPETIVSDNGSQFKANDFRAFLTQHGVKQVFTALYSPQSNASERVNRSVVAAIRAYLRDDHKEWDTNITAISCALRNSLHQALKCSPYHALFGFDMITHGSSYEIYKKLQVLDEPCIRLAREDELGLIRDKLKSNMRKAYEENPRQYNLRSRPVSFRVGQEVFRRNFAQSNFEKNFNAKLSRPFLKARVRERLGNSYYILEDLQGNLIGTFHAKDIRT